MEKRGQISRSRSSGSVIMHGLHKAEEVWESILLDDADLSQNEELTELTKESNRENFHSLIETIVLVVAVVVFVAAFVTKQIAFDLPLNVLLGLCACAIVLIAIFIYVLPDGVYSHPHPIVWRAFSAIGIIYLLVLVFLLFQNVDDVRQMLTHIDGSLGVPLPEKGYADDCALYTPNDPDGNYFKNLSNAVFDIFFVAHFFGWWIKTLIVRDPLLAFFLSCLFEVLEVSLQHWMTNFRECWWDRLILDIILCNGLGIFAGYCTLKFFDLKVYNFSGIRESGNSNMIIRTLTVFLPKNWTKFHWGVFSSWKRFLFVLFYIIEFELAELSSFTLKSMLWLKPSHFLNVIRLGIIVFFMNIVTREYYQFIVDKNMRRPMFNTWVAMFIIQLEWAVVFRWGITDSFKAKTPTSVVVGWVIAIILLIAFLCIYFPFRSLQKKKLFKTKTN